MLAIIITSQPQGPKAQKAGDFAGAKMLDSVQKKRKRRRRCRKDHPMVNVHEIVSRRQSSDDIYVAAAYIT